MLAEHVPMRIKAALFCFCLERANSTLRNHLVAIKIVNTNCGVFSIKAPLADYSSQSDYLSKPPTRYLLSDIYNFPLSEIRQQWIA
jgi:hypothetical protein